MQFEDILGRPISVGDIVVYVGAGGARNVPPLELGEVAKFTKGGISCNPLNKDFTREQSEGYDIIPNGRKQTYNGQTYYYDDYRKNGIWTDKTPVNIKIMGNKPRFYIVK